MKVYRHGDIIFREVEKLPEGVKKDLGTVFEQHGETGMIHSLSQVKVIEVDWTKFVVTSAEGGVVTHPEHPPLVLPPYTMFKVERVRSVRPYRD